MKAIMNCCPRDIHTLATSRKWYEGLDWGSSVLPFYICPSNDETTNERAIPRPRNRRNYLLSVHIRLFKRASGLGQKPDFVFLYYLYLCSNFLSFENLFRIAHLRARTQKLIRMNPIKPILFLKSRF